MLQAHVLGLSLDMRVLGPVRRPHVGPHPRPHVSQPRRSRSSCQGGTAPRQEKCRYVGLWLNSFVFTDCNSQFLSSFSISFGAAKILPVVKNQHLLLCTLLIGNSLAMEVPFLSIVSLGFFCFLANCLLYYINFFFPF